mgnify:CR=1 FL=1
MSIEICSLKYQRFWFSIIKDQNKFEMKYHSFKTTNKSNFRGLKETLSLTFKEFEIMKTVSFNVRKNEAHTVITLITI